MAEGDSTMLTCNYAALPTTVNAGTEMYIGDGKLKCEVFAVNDDHIVVKCLNACTLGEKERITIPGVKIDLPTVSEKDEDDIVNFGVKEEVDFICISSVRKADEVH